MVTEKIQPCSGKNEPAVGFGVCLAGGFKGFFSSTSFHSQALFRVCYIQRHPFGGPQPSTNQLQIDSTSQLVINQEKA
jgi:hypothetical protein